MTTTKTVTQRALVKRINRKLAADDEAERKVRGPRGAAMFSQDQVNLGDFYIVDVRRNLVMTTHVDLRSLARDLGVLASTEVLVSCP